MTDYRGDWVLGACGPAPRFPYSIYGFPRTCTCRWDWRFDVSRFVVTHPAKGCIWHTIELPRFRSRARTANASPTAKPK